MRVLTRSPDPKSEIAYKLPAASLCMISTFLKDLRLGYSQTGGEASLRIDELQGRLLILGARANEMAAVFAYASREAGLKPLILDMDGYLSSQVSGYFPPFRMADILYDLYR